MLTSVKMKINEYSKVEKQQSKSKNAEGKVMSFR